MRLLWMATITSILLFLLGCLDLVIEDGLFALGFIVMFLYAGFTGFAVLLGSIPLINVAQKLTIQTILFVGFLLTIIFVVSMLWFFQRSSYNDFGFIEQNKEHFWFWYVVAITWITSMIVKRKVVH